MWKLFSVCDVMAQKLVQSQALQQVQTLSPQQVLQVRLLEMPVSELEQRVKNEMIDNGALEERLGTPDENESREEDLYDAATDGGDLEGEDGGLPIDDYRPADVRQAMDDYRSPDDVPDYLLQDKGGKGRPETMEYGDTTSFYEQMTEQMNECDLTPHEKDLMAYLIGSLESDGLLKKKLSTIADELEIYNGVQTSEAELETVLTKLQRFDPPGIGARDLRECLLLQIRRDEKWGTRLKQQEYEIIDKMFDEFTHKRWDKIRQRLHLTEGEAERLQRDLKRLNPRPGSAMGEVAGHNWQQVVPDFRVETDDDGNITLSFNAAVTDLVYDGTLSASHEGLYNGLYDERYYNVADKDTSTKLYIESTYICYSYEHAWVTYTFDDDRKEYSNEFYIYSGNMVNRRPYQMQVQGLGDDGNWVVIQQFYTQGTWGSSSSPTAKTLSFTNTQAYNAYRLEFWGCESEGIELGEWYIRTTATVTICHSRTKNLFRQFVSVLSGVRRLLVYRTYAAREYFDDSGSALTLCRAVGGSRYGDRPEDILKFIYSAKEGDTVLFLGAGDIYFIARSLISDSVKN